MLKIEYISIAELIPYAGNAKEHPKRQIEQIAESIRQFGFNDPCAIDENSVLIEGHGRLFAARLLGMDKVPCIRLEGLTEQQKRAYTLVHNQLTMNTGFDMDQLEIELNSITDFDMSVFDFNLEPFVLEDIESVEGYDEENDDREYFESAFAFPVEHKKQIVSYLKKHKAEITEQIISEACDES